jgi:hypothetical protein
VLGILNVLIYVRKDIAAGRRREMHLLCDTDYSVLLAACRQLSSRVASGELKPDQYNIRMKPDPEASRFPRAILDLKPAYVIVDPSGIITIELHGVFLHYGVIAYPNAYKLGLGYKYGDRKLIDGLWYYNEDYKWNPDIPRRIEALIEKGKTRQAQHKTTSRNGSA